MNLKVFVARVACALFQLSCCTGSLATPATALAFAASLALAPDASPSARPLFGRCSRLGPCALDPCALGLCALCLCGLCLCTLCLRLLAPAFARALACPAFAWALACPVFLWWCLLAFLRFPPMPAIRCPGLASARLWRGLWFRWIPCLLCARRSRCATLWFWGPLSPVSILSATSCALWLRLLVLSRGAVPFPVPDRLSSPPNEIVSVPEIRSFTIFLEV